MGVGLNQADKPPMKRKNRGAAASRGDHDLTPRLGGASTLLLLKGKGSGNGLNLSLLVKRGLDLDSPRRVW